MAEPAFFDFLATNFLHTMSNDLLASFGSLRVEDDEHADYEHGEVEVGECDVDDSGDELQGEESDADSDEPGEGEQVARARAADAAAAYLSEQDRAPELLAEEHTWSQRIDAASNEELPNLLEVLLYF